MDPHAEDGIRKAEGFFRRAIELDPHYSDAWAALADALGRQIVGGWRTEGELATETKQAALTAVKLDADNGAALGVAAWALAILGGSIDEASDYAHRAVATHPNSALVRIHVGWALVLSGEFEAAIENLEAGRRMNPFDPRILMSQNAMANAQFFQRHFDEALKLSNAVLARMPDHPVALRTRAASLVHIGKLEDAHETIRRLLLAHPKSSISTIRTYFRFPWMVDLLVSALRTAGMPK